MAKQFWLMKSEPDVLSIDMLKNKPNSTEHWDGVRNYQARNFMRDNMKIGDQVLFYHSNAEPSGIAGLAEVASKAYPDHTSFDKKSKYYDPKSTHENPRWFMVDVRWTHTFNQIISLSELRKYEELKNMIVLKKGSRLSITPVTKEEFQFIKKIGLKSN